MMTKLIAPRVYHKTRLGRMMHGDSLHIMKKMRTGSVDLVMTSPPSRRMNILTGSVRLQSRCTAF